MQERSWLILAFCLWCGAHGSRAAQPAFFGAPPGALADAKACLASGDEGLRPALAQLLREADRALEATPPSVMQKTQVPPSGDKHDYLSAAPYFWPNPASSNGLPYIRHDGRVNPESRTNASDHRRLGRLADLVQTLSLAYYFTGKEAYAIQAARCLRVWFLEPATRMNPNLQFAQGVPGVNTGRGTGILEGRAIAQAADASQLLAGSSAWSTKDNAAFQAWLKTYLDWLLTSPNGRQEARARNNHGTWYDVQAIRLALVLGKTELAKQIALDAGPKRIAVQIEPDGRQPLELRRTAALGYSRFNLSALFALATAAEYVNINLWRYETPDGRSIRKALDFLLPYAQDPPKKWPFEQIRPFNPSEFGPLLLEAAKVYHEPQYQRVAEKYPRFANQPFRLFYPDPKGPNKVL